MEFFNIGFNDFTPTLKLPTPTFFFMSEVKRKKC